MKKNNLISGVILLFFALVITSCDDFEKKGVMPADYHDVVILADNTDTVGDRSDMVAGFMKNVMGKSYGNITFSYINDVSQNKSETISLNHPGKRENSHFDRTAEKKARKEFGPKFDEACQKFLAPAKAKDFSNIYRIVKTSLVKLEQSKADKKTLVILSDMIENSDCCDLYKFSGTAETAAKNIANCGGDLPKIENLEVIILYQPKGPKDDKQFKKALQVWNIIFSHYGISYKVDANI